MNTIGFLSVSAFTLYNALFVKESKSDKEVSPKTQQKVQDLAQKMSLKNPVKAYLVKEGNSASAIGNDFFGKNVIYIAENETDFVIAHELAHIKHKHKAKSALPIIACNMLWYQIFQPITWSSILPAGLALLTMQVVSQTLLWRYFEKQADITAALHISTRELIKGICFLDKTKSLQKMSRKIDNGWKINLRFKKNGDNFISFDQFPFLLDKHPSDSERIQYLSKIVYSREDYEQIPLTITIRSENEEDKQIKLSSEMTKEIRNRICNSRRKYLWMDQDHLVFDQSKGVVFSGNDEKIFHRVHFSAKDLNEERILQLVTQILDSKKSWYSLIDQDKDNSNSLEFLQKLKNLGYVEDRLEKSNKIYIACMKKSEEI